LKCPTCRYRETRVIDSRLVEEDNSVRRRRECLDCGYRFTTFERARDSLPLVIKKDGRREPYARKKIVTGIEKALEKRPVSVRVREELLAKVEKHLREGAEKEISSKMIGEKVMLELHELDEVAYVRFASVYRSFRDISEFMDELKELLKEREKKS